MEEVYDECVEYVLKEIATEYARIFHDEDAPSSGYDGLLMW